MMSHMEVWEVKLRRRVFSEFGQQSACVPLRNPSFAESVRSQPVEKTRPPLSSRESSDAARPRSLFPLPALKAGVCETTDATRKQRRACRVAHARRTPAT